MADLLRAELLRGGLRGGRLSCAARREPRLVRARDRGRDGRGLLPGQRNRRAAARPVALVGSRSRARWWAWVGFSLLLGATQLGVLRTPDRHLERRRESRQPGARRAALWLRAALPRRGASLLAARSRADRRRSAARELRLAAAARRLSAQPRAAGAARFPAGQRRAERARARAAGSRRTAAPGPLPLLRQRLSRRQLARLELGARGFAPRARASWSGDSAPASPSRWPRTHSTAATFSTSPAGSKPVTNAGG